MTQPLNIEHFIKSLTEFMNNTNSLLAQMKLRMDNIEVDIDKLKKKDKKDKIITLN